jgi:hypothetical protein
MADDAAHVNISITIDPGINTVTFEPVTSATRSSATSSGPMSSAP